MSDAKKTTTTMKNASDQLSMTDLLPRRPTPGREQAMYDVGLGEVRLSGVLGCLVQAGEDAVRLGLVDDDESTRLLVIAEHFGFGDVEPPGVEPEPARFEPFPDDGIRPQVVQLAQ